MARARRVVTGLWAGIVLCLGFIVAPSLFLLLDDPALAGRLAAHFFHRDLDYVARSAAVFLS